MLVVQILKLRGLHSPLYDITIYSTGKFNIPKRRYKRYNGPCLIHKNVTIFISMLVSFND